VSFRAENFEIVGFFTPLD